MSTTGQNRTGWANGDNLSNNFISDLGPLLSLFGEQVAKQFMSESMGWADNIIFAMGPLGIITAIVGAIRVGGPRWLKAIIGRARENRALAEVELMSSTSHEVCELWNGQQIVRIMGSSAVKGLIQIGGKNDVEPDHRGAGLYTLGLAKKKKVLRLEGSSPFQRLLETMIEKITPKAKPSTLDSEDLQINAMLKSNTELEHTPNISLNVNNRMGRGELHVVAVIGTILQFGVLVYAGCATYHPQLKFQKEGSDVAPYAFPLTSVGTLLLVAGMLICSYVIEHSTKEDRYRVNGTNAHMLWLQKSATVSDQTFDSYAVFSRDKRDLIMTSRRNCQYDPSDPEEGVASSSSEFITSTGTIVSLCGFFAQFIGLRGMHWSVAITQLGVTLVMTILRAWVRRGLAKRPYVQQLPPAHEIDWLATRIAEHGNLLWRESEDIPSFWSRTWDRICWRSLKSSSKNAGQFWTQNCYDWSVETGEDIKGYEPLGGDKLAGGDRAHKVMEARKDIGWLTKWPGPALDNAISVATAIEVVMNTLFTPGDDELLFWSMNAPRGERIWFKLSCQRGEKWTADVAEIEATLSLWLYSVREREEATQHKNTSSEDRSAWLRSEVTSRRQGLRLLGKSTESSRRDMKWWMGGGVSRVLQVETLPSAGVGGAINGVDTITIEGHRIVGFGGEPGAPHQSDNPYQMPKTRVYSIQQFPDDLSSISDPGGTQPSLAAISDAPLGLLFAQDMFSAFMWAVARFIDRKALERIVGQAKVHQTERVTSNNSTAWQSFTLQNPALSRMVQGVQRAGLGSLEEIQLSIIPPLSAEKKLPVASAVVELAREEAMRQESAGHWHEAGKIYSWAFQTCRTFGSDSPEAVKATAALTEFIRSITITVQNRGNQHRAVETSASLMEVRMGAVSDLTEFADKAVLSKLASMYEIHGRVEGYEEWKPQGLDSNTTTDLLSFEHTPLHEAILGTLGDRKPKYQALIEEGKYLDAKDILGWTPLHYAASRGDKNAVSKLLEGRANPNPKDNAGWTPLHYATWAQGVDSTVGRLLLQDGAEVDVQGRDGFTPLHCAASRDNVKMAKILIKSRARLGILDNSRMTPLHWAAYSDSKGIVELLLEAEAYRDLPDEYGRTPLHLAVSKGHDIVARMLLKTPDAAGAKALIETRDEDGWTALYLAADGGHKATVEMLLEAGADSQVKDQSGRTLLYRVAKKGHQTIVKILVDAGVDLQVKDEVGMTAMHWAACEGHDLAARVLLATNSDLHAQDKEGRTALHWAASGGYEVVVKTLLEAGSDLHTQDYGGGMALHCAASGVVVKILLEAGSDVHAQDNEGRTALHFAALKGHVLAAKVLLEAGSDVHARDNKGRTALHFSAPKGHYLAVKALLEAGSDVHSQDEEGRTALHLAARKGHDLVVKVLLEAGSDVHAKDKEEMTTLHLAAWEGHDLAVKVLLEAGSDLRAQNKRGMMALHWAALKGQDLVVKVLLEAGSDVHTQDIVGRTALHIAASHGYVLAVKVLLEAGMDVHTRDNEGRTELHSAASQGHVLMVKVLLEAGSCIHTPDEEGRMALHFAASQGHDLAVKVLLEAGSDVHVQDKEGRTALHFAASQGHDLAVKVLLEAGSDVHAQDKEGRSALHFAAPKGHKLAVKVLLEAGSDVHAKDKAGRTALHIAALKGHVLAVGVLLEAGSDIHMQDKDGMTALHWAAWKGHDLAVKVLLDASSDIHTQDYRGKTALMYAERHEQVVKLLNAAL